MSSADRSSGWRDQRPPPCPVEAPPLPPPEVLPPLLPPPPPAASAAALRLLLAKVAANWGRPPLISTLALPARSLSPAFSDRPLAANFCASPTRWTLKASGPALRGAGLPSA